MGLKDAETFRTRVGTIVSASRTECFSGRRDIGGSVVNAAGRIVLAAGASDAFNNTCLKVGVSDDGGENFAVKFEMPACPDVSYHTTGMLYDSRKDILMALFGETRGFRYWKDEDDAAQGTLPFPPDTPVYPKLMMARSVDGGESWKLFTLYDYAKNGRQCIFHGGIIGSGAQVDDELFVPQIRMTSFAKQDAMRFELLLSRIRNLSRKNDADSFEFEHDFRTLASGSEQDVRYADETVYIRKLDETGFISFHRPRDGMPCRREYDSKHNPVSDFMRVQSNGFDRRDFDPGLHGPMVIAFNVVRLPDGNLLMASRFYGTEHHRAGNIFLTSRDEGLIWDYADDQIPYSLQPLLFAPGGSGGNPSMSYMPDASLIHSTSSGCEEPLGDSVRVIGSTLVTRFQGMLIEKDACGEGRIAVSLDVSGVAGLEPVYIAKADVTGRESVECEHDSGEIKLTAFSSDRRRATLVCKVSGPNPVIKLKVVLANRANSHRPVFEPAVPLFPWKCGSQESKEVG